MKLKKDLKVKKNKSNMKCRKNILIISVLFLIVVCMNCGHLFANINTSYASDVISPSFVSDVFKNNSLASPIGGFFLFLAGVVEWFLSTVSKVVSNGGNAVMPWADAILFNCVPVLDVNFMNPSEGSIVGMLSGIIGGIYSTVLGIAIIFFGIAVMVMAIKLAISSIAAEKAKYKDALVNWAIGLVMLFTVHYLISFIFFLNENMVKVASSLVTSVLGTEAPLFTLNSESLEENRKKVSAETAEAMKLYNLDTESQEFLNKFNEHPEFFNYVLGDSDFAGKYLIMHHDFKKKLEELKEWIGMPDDGWDDQGRQLVMQRASELYDFAYYLDDNAKNNLKDSLTKSADVRSDEVLKVFNGYYKNVYKKDENQVYNNDDSMYRAKHASITIYPYLWGNYYGIFGDFEHWINEIIVVIGGKKDDATSKPDSRYYQDGDFINRLIDLNDRFGEKAQESGSVKNPNASTNKYPITMMAEYFRKNSYVTDNPEKDIMADDIYLPNALMYLIFVFQSLLYFASYLKRLFYVIILAIMAPVIVVFDFFSKS